MNADGPAVSTALPDHRKAAEAAQIVRPSPVTGLKPGANEKKLVAQI
jgi:hypothetical protein